VIGLIVDPEAAALASQAGEGARLDCGVGAKIGFAGERPVEADWRIERLGSGVFTGTGPMYGGARFNIGPMALVTDAASGVSAVLAAKRIQAADREMFRHVGIEPTRAPILGLKSTVHFRADFAPIAEAILCVRAPGAAISDPAELPYCYLRRGVRLRPLGPER
jgi:microcystin degradation protein MlrC